MQIFMDGYALHLIWNQVRERAMNKFERGVSDAFSLVTGVYLVSSVAGVAFVSRVWWIGGLIQKRIASLQALLCLTDF